MLEVTTSYDYEVYWLGSYSELIQFMIIVIPNQIFQVTNHLMNYLRLKLNVTQELCLVTNDNTEVKSGPINNDWQTMEGSSKRYQSSTSQLHKKLYGGGVKVCILSCFAMSTLAIPSLYVSLKNIHWRLRK